MREYYIVQMFRIKKLDIFIAKQFGLLFIGTFFICQFVLMMQFLWRYIDDLIGKGLTIDVMAQFFFATPLWSLGQNAIQFRKSQPFFRR